MAIQGNTVQVKITNVSVWRIGQKHLITSPPEILFPPGVVGMTRARGGTSPPHSPGKSNTGVIVPLGIRFSADVDLFGQGPTIEWSCVLEVHEGLPAVC